MRLCLQQVVRKTCLFMDSSKEAFRIWQWNCRGYSNKRAPLQQYFRSLANKPQVIALQETLVSAASLPGYRAVSGQPGGRGVCTLVDKKLTHLSHDLKLASCKVEYVMAEVLLNTRQRNQRRNSVFILNIYSNPRDSREQFKTIFKKSVDLAGTHPLVVVGDFNAPYGLWGYIYDTSKGRGLWQNANEMDLTLITDKAFPTRIGNSVCRDTTPDLAFVKNIAGAEWSNTAMEFGSDHYVLETRFDVARSKSREFTITDWDHFRKLRGNESAPVPEDLEDWCKRIKSDAESSTKKIVTDLEVEKMDSRLAHLIEAKQALLLRWKGQRLNRRLRKKISELNKAIEDHCRTLGKQQWDEVCDSIDGQMRNGKTWGMLKHLLDEGSTRSNQRHTLARALHEGTRSCSGDELVAKLMGKYLPVKHGDEEVRFPDYLGPARPELDEDFTVAEIRQAIFALNGKSAPGPDGITNKMLRNLDDRSIGYLTEKINGTWRNGSVPENWRTANTVLIPKPGKAPNVDNLRPISLTSCVGKVAEHVVLNRLSRYLEDNVYTHNMIGFRAGLSTQDAMKMIKHHIIDGSTRDTRALLGLDLEKAFDNVLHEYILASIADLELGPRLYNYVRSFLTGRKAKLRIGEFVSDEVLLGPRGTPQGSVISPALFNICMVGLSRKLAQVEGIKHTIYADDITIWCTGGSEGQVESAMQEAVDVTEQYLLPTGLRCSPTKSELLLYRKERGGRPKGWKPVSESDIHLFSRSGDPIPRVDTIRVLGMFIESGGGNGTALRKIIAKTDNAFRLVRRVTNRRRGLKEDNLLRLINAFVLCHFTYTVAMHNWLRAERDKLNALIRKIVKKALGLPVRTHTEDLLRLGIHNTMEEIAEAQERAQLTRLSTTPAGRRILEEIGLTPTKNLASNAQIPREIGEKLVVAPLPRNVHPVHNAGRRKARASTILKQICKDKIEASFVDAAAYRDGKAFAVSVVDTLGKVINCASVRTTEPEVAEQVAIALAMQDGRRDRVYSDSKVAVRAFQKGRVARQVVQILKCAKQGDSSTHSILWFPAHVGVVEGVPLNLNESAHEAARGFTDRAALGSDDSPPDHRDSPITHNEVTKFFYLARRVFPPPHSKLSRPQAVTLRLLQTNSYPNPVSLNSIYPDIYPNCCCAACGEAATLAHMLWECESLGPKFSKEEWDALLRSPLFEDQILAVQRARDRAGRLDLSVPSWD